MGVANLRYYCTRSLLVLFTVIGAFSFCLADINSEIMLHLKNGNAKGLVKHFSSSVNLSIDKDEGYYSKFQSELILEDFFRNNKPEEVKQIQKIAQTSNNQYLIYQLQTKSRKFRIFLKMNLVDSEMKVIEMRVE